MEDGWCSPGAKSPEHSMMEDEFLLGDATEAFSGDALSEVAWWPPVSGRALARAHILWTLCVMIFVEGIPLLAEGGWILITIAYWWLVGAAASVARGLCRRTPAAATKRAKRTKKVPRYARGSTVPETFVTSILETEAALAEKGDITGQVATSSTFEGAELGGRPGATVNSHCGELTNDGGPRHP